MNKTEIISIEDSKTRWTFFQKHQWVSPEFAFTPIFQSWQRCVKQMSAYRWSRPHIASGFTLTSLKRRNERIINCAVRVIEDTYDFLGDEKLLLLVTDDNGCVMSHIGHFQLEEKMAALGIKAGCFLTEDKVGTNAVSFAMETNMPNEVFAGDHFKRELHDLVTAAAPIIDTYGKLRGTIMLVRYAEDYKRENIVIPSSCAREVSLQLHIQSEQESMNRLQSAHSAALEYMDDGIISWDSENLISYTSRQAEKQLNVHSNDLLDRDIFTVIRFAPNIVSSIKQGEMLRRKQTTFEIDGRFLEAIITYRCMSDGTHLLFIHPVDNLHKWVLQQSASSAAYTFENLVCVSHQMKHVIRVARRAIRSNTPILITGEEGVGKSILAMAIHNESEYRDGPFISLNCRSTNPYQLLRDILGYDEGEGQLSKFELAQNGTLYIENIELLSTELQASLLNLLKTGLISRSDSERLIVVKFQLITGTSTNISETVSQGAFSRRLYYDLSVNELHIPPLRTRPEDVEYMVLKLISAYEQRNKVTIDIDNEVMTMLCHYRWSGNNSQLRNIVGRILLNRRSNRIELEDLPDEVKHQKQKDSKDRVTLMTLEELEKQAIIQSWKVFDGQMQEMAKSLNIGRTTLWRKVKKYDLKEIINLSSYKS